MVSTTQNRISYVGNGVTTAFAFPFYFQNPADLIVLLVTTATRVITPLIINTDYSVSGAFTPPFGYKTGGAVNIPGGSANVPAIVPGTQEIIIIRAPRNVQNLSLPANSTYPPVSTEAEFDSVVLMLQRAMDLLSRAVVLQDGQIGAFDPSLPAGINDPVNEGTVLVVNPTGTGFDIGPIVVPAGSSTTLVEHDTSGGDVNEILPAANLGKRLIIMVNYPNASVHNILVGRTGADLIHGQTTDFIESGMVRMYYSDGVSNWFVINS